MKENKQHPGWTLAVVCAAIFMLLLDLTVVAVALGELQRDFDADLADLQWVVDAYTLPLAGLLLTAATLGDRIGRRRIFAAGLALFTLGSLACALAWSALSLDVFRVVQGTGAALLFGTGLPLIGAAFPDPRRRAGAIGVFGATLTGATAVGPLVGGALVDGPGWRWIFLINVPIGLAALAVTRWRLTESRPENPRRADWTGTALLTGGLFALLLGLIRGHADGWGSPLIVGLFVVAGVLTVGFVVRQATAAQPMVDLSLFRSPTFTGAALSVFTVSAVLVGATTYLSLYFLNTLGYTPFEAGLRFLPWTLASFVAAPLAAQIAHRVSPRLTVGGSVLLAAIGAAMMTGLDGDSAWTVLIPGFIVAGIGMGVQGAVVSQVSLAAVEPARAGMATGVVNTLRQLGIAAGVAVWGVVYQARVADEVTTRLSGSALPDDSVRSLADAAGAGAGTRIVAAVPEALRDLVSAAARAAGAAGIGRMMLLGAIVLAVAGVAAVILVRSPKPAAPVPSEEVAPAAVSAV
ncbi:MFS transporter [Cryptosporangium aurantiacum]|uniref:Drug resistance transporter, EmrB/QacA subfamily n=1 Tax=Cryptosporangium aurantiacum TaxID=134849 RepID=A0A1M7RD65_9ACTN|nr:MFS transporter [Cryptosporangium aurantiacum]SHN44154.1 drug resistance transporter, EmrB/QacA subfamily [Cryptosporangium aurantiacum]